MSNFIPNPLHPAVVHMPIALILLLPFFAVGSMRAIRLGARPRRAWGLTTALLGLLAVSAGAAVLTGKAQADSAERTVGEQAVDAHEEAGEAFFILSGVVFAISVAGLMRGLPGRVARLVSTAGTLVLVVAGWQVGHSGGVIVYQHGAITPVAASAPQAGSSPRTAAAPERGRDDR